MPESVLNIDKNSLTDVSKATGLELILGNKQESNTEIFHSQSVCFIDFFFFFCF